MHVTFVDDEITWLNLLPLTYTKPISTLRIGVFTIQEKWEKQLHVTLSGYKTKEYLQDRFLSLQTTDIYINSSVLPSLALASAIEQLLEGECLVSQNAWLAYRGADFTEKRQAKQVFFENTVIQLTRPWDLSSLNKTQIEQDFKLVTTGRKSKKVTDLYTRTYASENIFLEEGVAIKAAILNAENGPIYLGKNATVHEGAIIKGPFALCEGGQVVAGAKIREGCTIGVKATGGGELKNCIIGDYSNKGHDGYLGDSVLGSWCNLGALTNVSNLKNTYSNIKAWDRVKTDWHQTTVNKLGCIMGDYVHTGISTMINTGTIIEPFCQLFGAGLHPKFIHAFQWGEVGSYSNYELDKALEVANKIQANKGLKITKEEIEILKYIHNTDKF